MPSKKFLEILFKKDDNFLRDKLQDSEIEDQIKAALEKENTQDFIKLQEVRIKRMMDIVNDQEQLQNIIISERYNQFKIKLVQIRTQLPTSYFHSNNNNCNNHLLLRHRLHRQQINFLPN